MKMNNSQILYLYDAQLTNPNGDPDEENRPRMDYERETNLVSDLRLKRYIRDYLLEQGQELFVQLIDNKSVTAKDRIEMLSDQTKDKILEKFIDVRLFGATMPIKGDNKTFIGPVQFNWGYSLNKVELLESSITSHFASSEKNMQGAIGKDYRVKYSLIAFSGVVSAKRAEKTKMNERDLALFDQALKKAIPLLATRSKIGQYPRLYIRVEYNNPETMLEDPRNYLQLVEKVEHVRSVRECSLEIKALKELFNKHKTDIAKINYFVNEELELLDEGEPVKFEDVFNNFELFLIE